MVSRYLERFKRLSDFPSDQFVLVGERMLIEVFPEEEMKTKSGLIIAQAAGYKTETQINRPMLAVVLYVGQGYVNEDGSEEEHEYKPGEVIICSKMGNLFYSDFPGIGATEDSIALTRPSEVHMSWPSIEAFLKFREALGA